MSTRYEFWKSREHDCEVALEYAQRMLAAIAIEEGLPHEYQVPKVTEIPVHREASDADTFNDENR